MQEGIEVVVECDPSKVASRSKRSRTTKVHNFFKGKFWSDFLILAQAICLIMIEFKVVIILCLCLAIQIEW